MTKVIYKAEFSVDLGSAVDSIGVILDEVNRMTSECGFPEDLHARGNVFSVNIEANRNLTDEETEAIKTQLKNFVNKRMEDYDCRLESFYRI